jgi:broad specificity phosphatase PhoE
MITTLYLVRHGEVENPTGILYGRLTRYRLSENGIKQIQETSKFLNSRNLHKIYTSPLLRARQTGNIIRGDLPISIGNSKNLIEINTSWQGARVDELMKNQFDFYKEDLRQSADETMEQIATRMKNFVEYIKKHHAGQNIVAVSHGDPIMILYALLRNMPLGLSSIRGDTYVTQGEVFQVILDNDSASVSSVFKPATKPLNP